MLELVKLNKQYNTIQYMSFEFLKSDCVEAMSFAQMRFSSLNIQFPGLVHFLFEGLSRNAAFYRQKSKEKRLT